MDRKRKIVLGASAGFVGLAGLGGVLLVLVLLIVVVAGLFVLPAALKGPVTAKINELVAENVDADVTLGDLELSMIESFPRLSVKVTGVEIKNKAPFEKVTLAKLPELKVGLNLWSVLRGSTFEIQSIQLVEPELHVVVNQEGRMNTDILKGGDEAGADEPEQPAPEPAAGSDAEGSGFRLKLKDLGLRGAQVRYDDRRKGGARINLSGIDFDLKGSFSQDNVKISTKGAIAETTARMGGIAYLKKAKTELDAKVDYALDSGAIIFGESALKINAFPIAWQGSITPQGEDYVFDLTFETREGTFASLLSLVPAAYSSSFEGLSSQGTLAFNGAIKGRYGADGTYPGLQLVLAARDARFQYPDLPPVENIDVDVAIDHPEGDLDLTVIDLKKLGFRTADAPFSARARIRHPMTDPEVDGSFHGRIDVAALRGALPEMADSIPATGQLDIDLDVAGRSSDFIAPNPDKIKADGKVIAKDLRPPTEGWPGDMRLASMDMAFSAQKVDVRELLVRYGESDLSASGYFDNLIGYGLGAGALTGALQVSSKHLDLRPFQGGSETEEDASPSKPAPAGKAKGKKAGKSPAPAQEGEQSADEGVIMPVPKDVAITVNGTFDHVVTELFSVDDARGELQVANQEVKLKDVKASAFGGEVKMSGRYAAPTAESADLDISIDSYRMDLGKTVATFTTLGEIAPLLTDAMGRFDAGISLVTRLRKDGTPEIEALSSRGMLGTSGVTVKPANMKKAADKLGKQSYSTIDLGGTRIAFVLEKGIFAFEPATVKLGGLPAKMSGKFGVLDQTVDVRFDTKIPTKELAGTPLLQAKKTFGAKIDVGVKLKGPWANPRVSVSLDGMDSLEEVVEGAVNAVVGAGVEELIAAAEKQGDALIAAAKESAANLLAEAQKGADALVAEAEKQGNKLLREAKNPLAEAAAKEAKKALDKEAKKNADKLIAEAKKAGDKLISEAEAKKAQLVADARAKAGAPGGSSESKSGKGGKAN